MSQVLINPSWEPNWNYFNLSDNIKTAIIVLFLTLTAGRGGRTTLCRWGVKRDNSNCVALFYLFLYVCRVAAWRS